MMVGKEEEGTVGDGGTFRMLCVFQFVSVKETAIRPTPETQEMS
jgi:hypothetical protein